MAGIVIPPNAQEGDELTHNGRTIKLVGGLWISVPQYTGPAGGGGGVDPQAVNDIIDTRLGEDLASKTDLNGLATTIQVEEATNGLATSQEVSQAVQGLVTTQQLQTATSDMATNAGVTQKINDLQLGTMSKSNMFVSTQAPDNAMGKDGDLWLQTAAS